jgi:hypothetical protein
VKLFLAMILYGHLWGGTFQMSVIGGRQVTGGNGRNPSGQKHGYSLNIEGFWLTDKFLVRAVTGAFAWLNPYQNRFIVGNQGDGGSMASWHWAQGFELQLPSFILNYA